MIYLMLIVSLACATGRNIISKAGGDRFSGITNMLGTNIMSSALALIVFGVTMPDLTLITGEMVLLALFYAVFSMLSPLLYIVAVGSGNVSVCSLIFGCGFLVPTLFGMIYSSEAASPFFILGLVLIVAAVMLVTGRLTGGGLKCLVPVTLAMLASGSLGVVQLLFSRSHEKELQNEFIFISFAFSLAIALTLSLILRGVKKTPSKKPDALYFVLGTALAVCVVTQNRLNLSLSGALPAILMFPVLNGGTIALSSILSAVIFREKFGIRKIAAVTAAIIAIILLYIPAEPVPPTDAAVDYITDNIETLAPASIGGDRTAMILAASEPDSPLLDDYRKTVREYIEQNGGVLHNTRYTEYSRVTLGLIAVGENPRSIGGYDITEPLLDFDAVSKQGVNGIAWALIALDSLDVPPDGTREVCERYIESLLASQNADGSFGAFAGSEVDMTAMCLRALALHRDAADVAAACERGVDFLVSAQSESGGFPSPSGECSEPIAQVIMALTALGISSEDAGFTAPISLYDTLLTYQNTDGGFAHSLGGESNLLATEQAVLALLTYEAAAEVADK